MNRYRFKVQYLCWAMILCFLLCFYPFTIKSAAAPGIPAPGAEMPKIYVDGKPVQYDIQPCLQDGVLLLPLRALGERAGFNVRWENELKRVTLRGRGLDVALYPENPLFSVNGLLSRTGNPPLLAGGRVLVGPDILEAIGIVRRDEDPDSGFLEFAVEEKIFPGGEGSADGTDQRETPLYFIELLLPPGDRVEVGKKFEMRLAAPFVGGIYAYEVVFFYNPSLIQVKDVRNPAYDPAREYCLHDINNKDGQMRYTFTTLGYAGDLPPRDTLAVIEAVVSREGAVPLIAGTFKVTLLDNRACWMPAGLEERILTVEPAQPGL